MSLEQVVELMFMSVSNLHPNDSKVVITSLPFANEGMRSERLLLRLEGHTTNRLDAELYLT